VLAEGFLDYREGIISEYGDGPLFPQIPLDAYGRRNGVSSPISKWLRNVVGIKDPRKPFHSHRHTATSYLRNTRLPDGEYAVKTDIERYLLGHSEKDSHAGYGKQWIETLKAAIEIIPNPLQAPLQDRARSISPDSTHVTPCWREQDSNRRSRPCREARQR
jgi:integrase